MDFVGVEASRTLRLGEATPSGGATRFDYPAAPLENRITFEGGRWRMRVTISPPGKPERVFADYVFRPAACRPEILPLG